MADQKGKQDEKHGDSEGHRYWQLWQGLYIISKQVASVETKVNKLLELAGVGEDEEIKKLTEQLRVSTESLQSAVEKNQPPKE